MEFRTELIEQPSGLDLDFSSRITMMGSCFAENIGSKLQEHQLQVLYNSHGILFNPISICNALHDVLANKIYTAEDLLEFNGTYLSLNHHGRYSSGSSAETLDKINGIMPIFLEHLKTSRALILTFGSSYAWRYKATGQIVANCHKIPQSAFEKTLIEHTEIESKYRILFEQIKSINPSIQIVLSVSPVRYFRDGIAANNLSKSHLLIACHALSQENGVHYLPAYEWILDDLRDYRFFKEDMLHPNDLAIQYVWEKFLDWSMKSEVINKVKQIGQLTRGLHHQYKSGNSTDEISKREAIMAKIAEITAH